MTAPQRPASNSDARKRAEERAINAPLHCLACGTSQREGMSYLAFIHAHAECEAS